MRTHAKTHARVKPSIGFTKPAVDFFSSKLEFEIGPYTLKAILDGRPDAVCVIDVRRPEQYAEAHIPGARSVPLDELDALFASLPLDKTLVTYCGDITCSLSTQAALELSKRGAKDVKHLIGGLAEWSRKGYQVESRTGLEDGGGPME